MKVCLISVSIDSSEPTASCVATKRRNDMVKGSCIMIFLNEATRTQIDKPRSLNVVRLSADFNN